MPTPVPVPLNTEPTPRWWPWVRASLTVPLLALPLLILLPPLLKVPAYSVAGGQITARSVASRTVIPAGTPVQDVPVRLDGKVIGSNMTGYVVGRFKTPNRTVVRVYSDGSHGTRALVFATQPDPTVLTPADPQALLTAWRAGQSGEYRPARAPGFDPALVLLLLPVLPLVWFLYSSPRVRYTREGDALVVRTAGSVTRLPRYQSSAVLTRDALGVRLFGSSLPGYYTGTFGTNSGNVQAAASVPRPGQAVIVTHEGRRYYLTPEDPQALVDWFGRRS